jgi:hypothetical protein
MIGGAKWQNFLNPLVYHLSFVICHLSLVIGHWSLVIGHCAEAKRVAGADQ